MPMHRQRLTKIAAHPVMGFNPQNCDHNIMTEPDLGRCRRTDGRKWRCSKSVVANEKYCERHMHRGRNRSRKHVETIGTVLKPQKQISGADDDNNIVVCLSALGDEVNKNINVESKESSFKDVNHSNISIRKHCEMKNNVGPISCGFGLSPKSVLHCSAGKVRPGLKSENIIENEPRRCERKDGKKRQCKQDVVANQKFCEVNMHRRAKRVISNQESDIPATSALRARLSCTSSRSPENGINLNIMPLSPRHISGNNCTSSTSDATTISDETISFCL